MRPQLSPTRTSFWWCRHGNYGRHTGTPLFPRFRATTTYIVCLEVSFSKRRPSGCWYLDDSVAVSLLSGDRLSLMASRVERSSGLEARGRQYSAVMGCAHGCPCDGCRTPRFRSRVPNKVGSAEGRSALPQEASPNQCSAVISATPLCCHNPSITTEFRMIPGLPLLSGYCAYV